MKMWIHIDFASGGNPYIVWTEEKFFDIVLKYELEQIGERMFVAHNKAKVRRNYFEKKLVLRDFAIYWQRKFEDMKYSYEDLMMYQDFFTNYGKKLGLLTEFRENCIC
jgi:hypothetical protein